MSGKFELRSPYGHGSGWEKNVEATWAYLNKHYIAQDDGECKTRINMWRGSRQYTKEEVRRLCSAIVHFEPVFFSRMTRSDVDWYLSRPASKPLKLNWHDNLRQKFASPTDAVYSIDAMPRQSSIPQFATVVEPTDGLEYCWHLRSLYDKDAKRKCVTYRLSWAFKTSHDAIQRTQLFIRFVQAAFVTPPAVLQNHRHVITPQGLDNFLQRE